MKSSYFFNKIIKTQNISVEKYLDSLFSLDRKIFFKKIIFSPSLLPSEGSHSTQLQQPALLAEFVENLLKHEDGSGAAEYGERLASKEGIHHAGHGCAQQRLHGTLSGEERVKKSLGENKNQSKFTAARTPA